jgi:hypothetical protein
LEIVAGGKDIEMTLIYCSVQGVNYAAAAFALVAAVLWFVSASVKTPSSFDINFEISVSSYDGWAGGTGYSLGLSNLAGETTLDCLTDQPRVKRQSHASFALIGSTCATESTQPWLAASYWAVYACRTTSPASASSAVGFGLDRSTCRESNAGFVP